MTDLTKQDMDDARDAAYNDQAFVTRCRICGLFLKDGSTLCSKCEAAIHD